MHWREAGICDRLLSAMSEAVDAKGRPIKLGLTASQTNDCKPALDLLSVLETGAILLADKTYNTEAIRVLADKKEGLDQHPAKEESKGQIRLQQMAL